MTISEIRKILSFCKKKGVKRIKMNDFEVEFNETLPKLKAKMKSAPKLVATQGVEITGEKMPTEDEMLFFSSPFFDDLQAQRKSS